MAVKRRVIWLSDDEWTRLGAFAKDREQTVSEVVRGFVFMDHVDIAIEPALVTRHVQEFRPVPKPGRK